MYKREIEDLKSNIASARQNIKNNRENMARMRANKGPKHYQESGKKNIAHQKKIIEGYNKEIAKYREKKKKMGKGTDSFKRELGKNTGKWVSNKVFGDGHSTPHRVEVNRKNENTNSSKSFLEKSKDFFDEDNEVEDFELKKEIAEIKSQKETILAKSIPTDNAEIMDLVNMLLANLKEKGWKFGDKDEQRSVNSFSDVCLVKLEQCLRNLKKIKSTDDVLYLETEIKKLKKKRIFQKYWFFILAGFLAITFFILFQLGIIKD